MDGINLIYLYYIYRKIKTPDALTLFMPGRAVQREIFLNRRHVKNILSLPLTLYDFEFLCIYKRITKEKIKNIFFCGRHEDLAVSVWKYLAYLDLSLTTLMLLLCFYVIF